MPCVLSLCFYFYSSRPKHKRSETAPYEASNYNYNQFCAQLISCQEKARREVGKQRADKHPVEAMWREVDKGLFVGSGSSPMYPESPGSLMYGNVGDSLNQESAIVDCPAAADLCWIMTL